MYAAVDDIWDPHFVKKNFDVLESDENIVGSIGKVTFELDFFKNKQNIKNHSVHRVLVLNTSGTYEDRVKSYLKLNQFQNVQFCYNLNQYKTLLHFIYSDLLITCKSSFSYKPALICKGIKVCPKNFWHKYPKGKDWILLN